MEITHRKCMAFVAENRIGDKAVTPLMYLEIRKTDGVTGKYGETLLSFPAFEPYEVTLPLRSLDKTNLEYSRFTIVKAAEKSSMPWRDVFVVKTVLPVPFEDPWFVMVKQFNYTAGREWPMKVKVFFSQPNYDDVTDAVQLTGDYLADSVSIVSTHKVLPPVPQEFYVALTINEWVPPGSYEFGMPNYLVVCEVESVKTAAKHACQGLQASEETLNLTVARCACTYFGTVYGVPKSIRQVQILLDPITFVVPVRGNAVVVGCALVMAVVLLLLLTAFLCDRHRLKNEHVHFVADAFPGDNLLVLLGVFTGVSLFSGTWSHIAIKIIGTQSSSRVHILNNKRKKFFRWMGDDWFIIPVKEPLGVVTSVCMWHDFHHVSDWYCSRLIIFDSESSEWYFVLVERWFMLSDDDQDSRKVELAAKEMDMEVWEMTEKRGETYLRYFMRELQNDHVPLSVFTMQPRYIGFYEHLCLIFLVKVFGLFFLSWLVLGGFDDHGHRSISLTRISSDTLLLLVTITLLSRAITIPCSVFCRWYVRLRNVQLKVTNPLIELDPEGKTRFRSKSTSKSPRRSRSRSRSKRMRSKSPAFSYTRRPNAEMQYFYSSIACQCRPDRLGFIPFLFGPCQLRLVNANLEFFRSRKHLQTARYIVMATLVLLISFLLYVELFTHHWLLCEQSLFFVLMGLLLDAVLFEPLIISLKSLAAYSIFGFNHAERFLYDEHNALHVENTHAPLDYTGYIKQVTKRCYKPFSGSQLAEKHAEQKFLRAALMTAFYILILGAAVCSYYQFSWVRRNSLWATHRSVMHLYTVSNKVHGTVGASLAEVVEHKMFMSYIKTNFVSMNSTWRNSKNISSDGMKWGKDHFSKALGATNIIIHIFPIDDEDQLESDVFFGGADFGRGISSQVKEPLWIADHYRHFKDTYSSDSIRGRSGTLYTFEGHTWEIPVTPWVNFFSSLRKDLVGALEDEYKRKYDINAIILSCNFLLPYLPGLMTVDFLVEDLPSGVLVATVKVQVNQFADKDNAGRPKFSGHTARLLTCLLTICIFFANIAIISKVGIDAYFTKPWWIVNVLHLTALFLNGWSSAFWYHLQFEAVQTIADNPSDVYTDTHRMYLFTETVDGLILSFLLLMSVLEVILVLSWIFRMERFSPYFVRCCRISFQMTLFLICCIQLYKISNAISGDFIFQSLLQVTLLKTFFPVTSVDYSYFTWYFAFLFLAIILTMKIGTAWLIHSYASSDLKFIDSKFTDSERKQTKIRFHNVQMSISRRSLAYVRHLRRRQSSRHPPDKSEEAREKLGANADRKFLWFF